MRLFTLLCCLCLFTFGCGSDDADNSDIRFFNAIVGADSVTVRIDSETAFQELPYGLASPYYSAERGSRRLRIDAPGVLAPVIDERFSVVRDTRYNVYLVGSSVNDAAAVFVRDSLRESLFSLDERLEIDDGEFRLRFAHLSPRNRRYDIYLTEGDGSLLDGLQPLLSSAAFRQSSRYFDLPQGQFRVIATEARTRRIVLDSGPLNIGRSNSYSFLIYDQLGGGSPLLSSLVRDD
jgi:hypothetical protein